MKFYYFLWRLVTELPNSEKSVAQMIKMKNEILSQLWDEMKANIVHYQHQF